MHWFIYPLIIVAGINLLLGLIVAARKFGFNVNLLFFLLALSVAFWPFGIGMFYASSGEFSQTFWVKVYYLAAAFIAYFWWLFAGNFRGRRKIPKSLNIFVTLFLGLVIYIILAQRLIVGIFIDAGHKTVELNSRGYFVYSLFFLCIFYGGTLLSYYSFKGTHEHKLRFQHKLIFISALLASIFGVLFNLVLPGLENYRLIWIGPLLSVVFTGSIFYAIVKHRLFDIRLIIARSLGYLLSLGLLVGSFFALSYIAGTSLSGLRVTQLEAVINAVLIVLGALSYARVKRFFDRVTNRIFYRDAYDAQAFLDQLNKVLVANVDLKSLLIKTAEIIQENIKSDSVVFNIRQTAYHPRRVIGSVSKAFSSEDIDLLSRATSKLHERVIVTDELTDEHSKLQERLRRYDISLLTRLATATDENEQGVDFLMLGVKKSGNPYSKQDVRVLGIVANELVIAIQNALRFEEIEQFTLTLQQKVDDATHKLVRTNEKLKALDETKDEFISMASHQLRTPLTSVKGYLSMVLEGDVGKVSDSQRKMLDQAFISSQRMVYLIADLLNVSRLRTGKFVIEPVACNLADVIEGEVGQLKETAASRNLELIYKKPKEFPTLMLDETKIRQVAMNFMDNAIYYTPAGGKIVVEVADKGSSIEYTVTDNGLGVPKADQQHLFNKFYRAGNARKARPDGTGLGLFMAKKVVIASGGSNYI